MTQATGELPHCDALLTGARPQVMAALLRYFRDLDRAEEAFQEACLRAIQKWPMQGPPRDPVAWLIMVARNHALDQVRRERRQQALPDEEVLSDLEAPEPDVAERLDNSHYRDDILRLLFVCCHSTLPATQQIALALRIVAGLSVKEIARAFLVSEAAMEQRITRAKRAVQQAGIPFETPGAVERAERLGSVASMLYLVFNEGYSSSGGELHIKGSLCDEAIRLARLLLRLFPSEAEIMGLLALMLLQHARTPARLNENGELVLLEDQNRQLWNDAMIREGVTMLEKAMRHQRPGSYQIQAAIAALHDQARSAAETDWQGIERLYQTLEHLQPSPVITLNRAVALSKAQGAEPALALISPLAKVLDGYFYYHGVRGALCQQLGQHDAARESFVRAIALANTPAEATYIRSQLDSLNRA